MTLPNFFLVGAAKSGTTTLYEALRAHPEVYLPALKEPHVYAYLADPSTANHLYCDEAAARRSYRALYDEVNGERAVGDASTTNLVVAGAAETIAREIPDARIVAILRHPVDRAFSHYCHFVSAGGEDLREFADAVAAEADRQRAGLPFTYRYLGWSRYAGQLRPYLELFGPDRVLVHLYDDLCRDGEAVLRATFRHLGVAGDGPLPPLGRSNELPARPATRVRLSRLGRWRAGTPPPRPTLDPTLRAELTASFEDEIRTLEELLERDLSGWRN